MTMAVSCESCGMPLAGAEDHALADQSIPYCNYCAPEGKLQAVDERGDGACRRIEGHSVHILDRLAGSKAFAAMR